MYIIFIDTTRFIDYMELFRNLINSTINTYSTLNSIIFNKGCINLPVAWLGHPFKNICIKQIILNPVFCLKDIQLEFDFDFILVSNRFERTLVMMRKIALFLDLVINECFIRSFHKIAYTCSFIFHISFHKFTSFYFGVERCDFKL